MDAPLRRRIRWDNVARLAAALTVIALVVAWAGARDDAPRLPSGAAQALPAISVAAAAPPVQTTAAQAIRPTKKPKTHRRRAKPKAKPSRPLRRRRTVSPKPPVPVRPIPSPSSPAPPAVEQPSPSPSAPAPPSPDSGPSLSDPPSSVGDTPASGHAQTEFLPG